MKRYEAIEIINDKLKDLVIIVSSNGYLSRELFLMNDKDSNFYMIGSMGLTSPIALGIALSKPKKKVIVIEGDASILMNLGALATIGNQKPKNFLHIILDNEMCESTGGQKTASQTTSIEKIAAFSGYRRVKKVKTKKQLEKILDKLLNVEGPNMILCKIEEGTLNNLPRVEKSPEEIKKLVEITLKCD